MSGLVWQAAPLYVTGVAVGARQSRPRLHRSLPSGHRAVRAALYFKVLCRCYNPARMPLLSVLLATALAAQASSWLDRPMARWNPAGAPVPAAPASAEAPAALARRCASLVASGSDVDAIVAKAGWVPFLHLDRRLTRDDIEVVGGMVAAGPACDPTQFHLFVFVGGRFAGTLSPSPMRTARDGVAGSVRITAQDAMTSEFARYTASDSECCPSSVVRVSYRINRAGAAAVIEATEARQVR